MATEFRRTGIDVVGDAPWGTHFCHFYETKQDLLDTLVPYFKAGLESKEFCLWVVSDSELITVEEAKGALAQAVPDLERHISDESIEILNGHDWYFEQHGLNLERAKHGWDAKLKRALARGYEGLRASADTFWLAEQDWKDFFAYEKQVNDWITDQSMTVMCTYPLAKSGATEVLDVVQAHQFAIARRQGEWEVIESPQLIQAKAEVKRLNEDLEQRVIERTNELRDANEKLRKEIAERKQAEALLHAKEQEFRAIVENAPDQIIRYDREFRRAYVNPAVAKAYGLPVEALIGKPIGSVIEDAGLDVRKDEITRLRQQIANVFDSGQSYQYELNWPLPKGRRYFSVRLFPELDLNGSVVNVLGISRDITERKEAEEALDERLRFETLVTELSAAFANLSANQVDREIDKWLQTLTEFLGVDRASFFQFEEDWTTLYRSHSYTVPGIEPLPQPPIGMKEQFPWITDQLRRGVTVKWSRIPDDMLEEAAREKEYAARLGAKSGLNIPVRMGGSVICAITFTSIVNYRDWPDAMVARLRLVGEIFAAAIERKRAEAALRESEERFRQIAENIREVFWMSTADLSNTLYISPAYEAVWGRSRESLYREPRSFFAAIHPEDGPGVIAIVERNREQGFEVEYRVVRPDGSFRWIWDRGFPIRDESGRSYRLAGIAEDITERKLAVDAVKRAEDHLRLVLDTTPALIHTGRPDGYLDYFNQRWLEYVGRSLEDLQGWGWTATMHPDDVEGIVNAWRVSLASGEPLQYEARVRRADGEYRWMLHHKVPLRDEHGNIVKWHGSSLDIEDRKRAEEKLKQSERQLSEAQRLAHVGSWDWDIRSNAVTWSDELYRIFGLEPGRIKVGGDAMPFIHPEDRDLVQSTVKIAVKNKEPYSFYYRVLRPDGEERIVHSRGHVLSDEHGEPVRVFGATQDITELKRAAEKLKANSEQLRALSARLQSVREEEATRIAREIHDELGSALTRLKWDLELLSKERLKTQESVDRESSGQRIDEMIQLVDATVDTVRRISSELRPSILDDLGLAAALRWHTEQFQHRTGIVTDCDCSVESLGLNQAQSTAVFRIFEEALTNVMRHAGATKVDVRLEKDRGDLVVTIRDNGRGITEAERLDPSSLGLLGMRERVSLIGGEISIAGIAGEGTLVTVRLPISRKH